MRANNIDPERQHSFISLMMWAISLSRPYVKWVVIILLAMVVEAVMSVATPWPLKIIIDDVVAHGTLPHWLQWLHVIIPLQSKVAMAAVVALAFVLINVIGSLAGYINSYYNENVAQHIANDSFAGEYIITCSIFLFHITIHTRQVNCLVRSLLMFPPSRILLRPLY